MRPSSLVLCVPSLAQGGAERVVCWLADGLEARGHEVVLVTAASRERDFYSPPALAQRVSLADDMGARSGVAALRALHELLTKRRPDLVISFLPRTNIASVLISRLAGCRVAVCERIDPRMEQLPWSTRIGRAVVYPLAHGIVLQTAGATGWARRRVPLGRLAIIPNPVRPLTRPAGIEPAPVILGVGRLYPQKRFDRLIDVFAAIAADFPQLRLRIVGDGPMRDHLRRRASATGFGQRIEFPGAIQDIESEYAHAKLFVLTSDFEGFPNVLAEAMSLGLPVVAVDCPTGPAEMIRSGTNGILVPRGDEQGLISAIRSILQDEELATRLGQEARNLGNRYLPEMVLDQWEAYIAEVSRLPCTRETVGS